MIVQHLAKPSLDEVEGRLLDIVTLQSFGFAR